MKNLHFFSRPHLKHFFIFLLLTLTVSGFSQSSLDAKANQFAESSKNGNNKVLLELYHPIVIKDLGGEKKAKSILDRNYDYLKEEQIVIDSFQVLEPVFELKGKQYEYALLPYFTIMNIGENKMKVENYLFAVSELGADDWKFFNTGNYQEVKLIELFPELEGEFEIPSQTFESVE